MRAMRRFVGSVLLSVLVFVAPVRAADPAWKLILDDPVPDADRTLLEQTLARGIAAWRASIGPIDHPPVIHVGGGAMRAGYSAERDEIGFPASGEVKAHGIRSRDVVLHELFHALASQFPAARAAASGDDDQKALHEALADLFAHTLEPDALFGEDYYADRPYVRAYHSDLCYALARGPHARGNALVSRLIDAGYTLADVGCFLREQPFTREALLELRRAGDACLGEAHAPDVSIEPRGYPSSMLQRFVLDPARPLELVFRPDAAFRAELGKLDVSWDAQEVAGLGAQRLADEGDAVVWRLTATAGAPLRKAVARLLSGGKVVGFVPFYFRIR